MCLKVEIQKRYKSRSLAKPRWKDKRATDFQVQQVFTSSSSHHSLQDMFGNRDRPNTTHSFLLNPFNPKATPADPGHLSLTQQDLFFSYQQSSTNGPYGLDNESIWASGLVDHKTVSKNVLHSLQKAGVVVKDNGNVIDTGKIGPRFTHQLAEIPARQQKQIVDLLFWWEEECQRLRKLVDEKAEIEGILKNEVEGERKAMMKALLERVEKKLRAKPSERDDKLERDEDELMVRFREGMGASTGGAGSGEAPPQYSRS